MVAEPPRDRVVVAVMTDRISLAVSLVLLAGACTSATPAGRATPSPTVIPAASREPSELPRFAEEPAVVDALTAGGMRVELVGGSKADTLLGVARRARVFIGTLAGSRVGADVLFLDAPPGDVRVCTSAGSASGFTKFTITVDGRPGSTGEGSQSMSFAVSDRYFVMSSDVRVRDALRDGLGLSEPRC
jgi:hypothetical protein